MLKIHTTTDYSIFKFLKDSNRVPAPKYIIDSILKKNMLAEHPIICDADMNVIDGQNRLRAAEALDIPIYYIISENISEEDIAICQIQKSWQAPDYLKFFRKLDSYKFLMDVSEMYKFPIYASMKFCSGDKNVFSRFKKGEFSLSRDKEFLHIQFSRIRQLCDMIKDILKNSGSSIQYIHQRFLAGMWTCINAKEYDHSRMVHAMQIYPCNVIPILNFNSERSIRVALMERLHDYGRKKRSKSGTDLENLDAQMLWRKNDS